MTSTTNNNTLLSQKEIDTLIRFLTNNTEKVNDAVLSQDSIDKLIALLQQNGNMNMSNLPNDVAIFNSSAITTDLSGYCLFCSTDEATGFVTLTAKKDGAADIKVTPTALSTLSIREDESVWGLFIEPVVFDKVATIFHAKYMKDTFDMICRNFAEKRFMNPDAVIPAFFLPSAESLSNNVIL